MRLGPFLLAASLALANCSTASAADTVALGEGWLADRWTRQDGLPLDHINDVIIDSDGIVWLATFDGLVRFDGVRFDTLRSADPLGPPSSRVVFLAIHPRDGALWVVSEHGSLQRRSGGEVRNFDTVERSRVAAPSPDDETIWIAIGGQVLRLDDVPVLADSSISDVQALLSATDGGLWLLTKEGRILLRHRSGQVDDLGIAWSGPDTVLYRAVSDGGPAYSTREGLVRWDLEAGAPRPLEPRGTRSASMPNRISRWAMDGEGLMLDGVRMPPVAAKVAALAADGDVAWVATEGDGLVRIRPRPVQTVRPPDGQPGNVHRLWWEAVNETLWALSDPQGWWPVFTENGAAVPLPEVPAAVADKCGQERWRFFSGEHGERWLFRCDQVFRHDGEAWERVIGPQVDHEGPVWRTGSGDLWLGGSRRTWRLAGGRWSEVGSADGAFGEVLALGEGPNGEVLLGTPRGLWRVERGADEAARLDEHTPLGRVRDVRIEGERAWIATDDLGLCVADPWSEHGFVARCLGGTSGVGRGTIHATSSDRLGRVWMSSNRGIGVIDGSVLEAFADGEIDDVSVLWLTERDGMFNSEANNFVGDGALATPDGRLWFATQDGVAVVDPDRFAVDAAPTVHWIEEAAGEERRMAPKALELPVEALPARLRWSIGASPWADQAELRYRNSRTQPWNRATGGDEVVLAAVPQGESTLEAQARLGGAWGPITALSINRAPTLMERGVIPWLAVLAAVFATIGGLVGRARLLRRANQRLGREVEAQTRLLTVQNQRLEDAARVRDDTLRMLAEQHGELEETNRVLALRGEELRARNRLVESQSERLQELDRLKRKLLANVSHELRTPLALILGPLRDLGAEALEGSPQRRLAGLALANAEHLQRLIDQLFELALAQAGALRPRVRRLSPRRLLARVIERFEGEAAAKGVSLCLEATSPVVVWADAEMIDRVLVNLLANALRFSPSGSRVHVVLSTGDGSVRVSVVDEGPGVPPEHLLEVFERFFQVEQGADREHGGAGLGLALVKELVELHGGEVGLDPSRGGAHFWFTLPLGNAHFAPGDIAPGRASPLLDEEPPVTPSLDQPPGRSRILLVEDHTELREYLAEHLRGRYEVRTACDGPAALALVAQQSFDLIVCDIMMPRMDGRELVRRLQRVPGAQAVPVIFISALQQLDDRVEGLALADDYLTKPFQVPELVARVGALLRRGRPAEVTASEPARPEPAAGSADPFVVRLEAKADRHISESGFGIQGLARAMGMSTRSLQIKMQALDLPVPVEWLRTRRLETAAGLLRSGMYSSIGKVADAVGMSHSYFSRAYLAHTGRSPRDDLVS